MFPFFALTALTLETLGLLVVVVWFDHRARPREAGGVWAAGKAALPTGAALFYAVLVLKGLVVKIAPSLTHPPDPGWGPLLVHGLVAGMFAGVAEEVVRFAAIALLFRHARGKPLMAGVLFALGWGGFEVLLVVIAQLQSYLFLAQLYNGLGNVSLPFVPLLTLAERVGALMLHVAMTGLAVAAAMALARGRAAAALALFAAAVAAHALLDAWVRVMYVRYGAMLDVGDARGIAGTVLLEAVFVTGGFLTLLAAARIPAPAPLSEAAPSPAP